MRTIEDIAAGGIEQLTKQELTYLVGIAKQRTHLLSLVEAIKDASTPLNTRDPALVLRTIFQAACNVLASYATEKLILSEEGKDGKPN